MKLRNGMKLPDWVKWVARDENYELWGFTDEPSKEGDVWKTEYGIGYCERLDDVDDIYNDIQWDDEKPTPVNKSLHKGGKTEMKKDIEWLKEKLQTMINQEYRCYDPLIQQTKHTCKIIMDLIDQLDEPKKVVIPQFVADWFENDKEYMEIEDVFWQIENCEMVKLDVDRWISDNKNTFLRAWLDGYGVEKDKSWIVLCGDLYTYDYNLDQEDIRLTRQKDRSYIFKDKEIATSVAALCSGRVEEVTE